MKKILSLLLLSVFLLVSIPLSTNAQATQEKNLKGQIVDVSIIKKIESSITSKKLTLDKVVSDKATKSINKVVLITRQAELKNAKTNKLVLDKKSQIVSIKYNNVDFTNKKPSEFLAYYDKLRNNKAVDVKSIKLTEGTFISDTDEIVLYSTTEYVYFDSFDDTEATYGLFKFKSATKGSSGEIIATLDNGKKMTIYNSQTGFVLDNKVYYRASSAPVYIKNANPFKTYDPSRQWHYEMHDFYKGIIYYWTGEETITYKVISVSPEGDDNMFDIQVKDKDGKIHNKVLSVNKEYADVMF